MSSIRRALKELDLLSWDNWVPLAVIAAFSGVGILTVLGVIRVIGPMDPAHFKTVYDSIGMRTTAGILSTIIALSLVAIQFASNQYTHRIMAFYIRSITFWAIITVYLAVIVFSILVAANKPDSADPRLAGLILVGTVMALMLLIPHFLITASFLKPDFIINKLLRRLDSDYLLSVQGDLANRRGRLDSKSDRLLPVIEIIESAIKRGDRATTRMAMEQLHDKYLTQAERLNSLLVEQYFLSYVLRVGRKAVSVPDEEEAAVQAVQLIGTVGARGPAGAIAVAEIRDLGLSAHKKGIDPVVSEMIHSLREIFEQTEMPEAKKEVLDTFHTLAQELATAGKTRPLRRLATDVSEIAQASLSRRDMDTAYRCLDMLETIGHDSGIHKLVDAALHVVKLLLDIGVVAAQDDGETANRIIRTVLRIEMAIGPTEREAIAATSFAKGDIERVLNRRAPQAAPVEQNTPPTPTPAPALKQGAQEESKGEFADLWGEPQP